MSARDQVLDAYEEILIREGERAATMDAVAALAGVSKGGLLYHFKSKDALVEGLADRVRELAEADLATMRAAPEGPASYYVGTSAHAGSPFDRALVATARLVQDANPRASEAMRAVQQGWYSLIEDEVGDPAIARAILLLGDGLYYNAALAGGSPGSSGATADEDVESLLGVVDLLKAHASA